MALSSLFEPFPQSLRNLLIATRFCRKGAWLRVVGCRRGAAALTLCVFAVMGKAEGSVAREEWHGHVTALSVAPEFRRLGLAAKLMELLEEISEK